MPCVLVTGSNRGLGLEFCNQYAKAGWKVLACCRQPEKALALSNLAEKHPNIRIHKLDVRDFSEIDALSKSLAAESIDVLLCNAAIYSDNKQNGFEKIDYDSWLESFKVNSLAPVKLAESFLPQLKRSQLKLIVGITSLMGSISDNSSGGSLFYRSSKSALNAAMKSLSIDLAPQGIGVLLLHPGWVKTDMGGEQAPLTAEPSISGMIKVIGGFSPKQSGSFLNYKGDILPW